MAKKKSLSQQRIAVLGTTEVRNVRLRDHVLTKGYKLFVVSTRSSLNEEDAKWARLVGADRTFLLTKAESDEGKFDAAWKRFFDHLGLPWPKSERTGLDCHWEEAVAQLPRHGVENHITLKKWCP